MVRIGIIGAGGIGTKHAQNIRENKNVNRCELTAVCDHDRFRLTQDIFSGVKHYEDYGDLIRSGDVDAVIICTPHYEHVPIGIDALEQGLHVLVEKPIAVHKADAERLIAAHTNPDQVFAAMLNERTDPHYYKIKQLVDSGELGEIQRVNWIITYWFRSKAYYESGTWRATWQGEGGGVLLNQCPHNLDVFQWICGMPSRVWAKCAIGKYHDIEVEDEVTAYLEYPNGATGVFITSTGEAPGSNRLEIAGDRGKVVCEDEVITLTQTEISVKEYRDTTKERFKKPPAKTIIIPADGRGEQHVGILQNFIDAILDGAPLLAPAEEGIRSLELGNAMLYSSLKGMMVEMPLDGEAYENELNRLIEESTFNKKTVKSRADDIEDSF